MPTYTYAELFDAIEKNGYPKAKRSYAYFNSALGKHSYCALGQAAKNLGYASSSTIGVYLSDDDDTYGLYLDITNTNDRTNMTLPEIAAFLRDKYKNQLNNTFTISDIELMREEDKI